MVTAANELPAILGGEPAVTLDQAEANLWPLITDEDEQAVLSLLRQAQWFILEPKHQ